MKLFNLLKEKLGVKESHNLISFVKNEVDVGFDRKKHVIATRKDIDGLRGHADTEFSKVRLEIIQLTKHNQEEFSKVRLEMVNMKTELTKSIYMVGLGQFLAIICSILLIVGFLISKLH